MFNDYNKRNGSDLMFLTFASVAMTIPFLCYMKRMSDSLEKISDKNFS